MKTLKNPLNLLFFAIILILTACDLDDENTSTLELSCDFDIDQNEWVGGFADYGVGREEEVELNFFHDSLPPPLDTTQGALRITGRNLSDNLFMFTKTNVTGLAPNTVYELTFDIELAHNAPEESVGIGGSPGASNFLKVGAAPTEPMQVAVDDFYRLNLDKGNQSQGGDDAIVIGNIGHDGDEFEYRLIQRDNSGNPLRAATNDLGQLWLFIGVDSGFEGVTNFYITEIRVTIA